MANIDINKKIFAVLTEAYQQLSQLSDPFYIIGSAALALVGIEQVHVSDIDIFTSNRDAEYLMEVWSERRITKPNTKENELFKSNFSQYHFTELNIEVMGELKVKKDTKWKLLVINEYTYVDIDYLILKIPTLKEQVRILKWFGREKDLEKMPLIINHLNKQYK